MQTFFFFLGGGIMLDGDYVYWASDNHDFTVDLDQPPEHVGFNGRK